jgi:hypothetical protein
MGRIGIWLGIVSRWPLVPVRMMVLVGDRSMT